MRLVTHRRRGSRRLCRGRLRRLSRRISCSPSNGARARASARLRDALALRLLRSSNLSRLWDMFGRTASSCRDPKTGKDAGAHASNHILDELSDQGFEHRCEVELSCTSNCVARRLRGSLAVLPSCSPSSCLRSRIAGLTNPDAAHGVVVAAALDLPSQW